VPECRLIPNQQTCDKGSGDCFVCESNTCGDLCERSCHPDSFAGTCDSGCDSVCPPGVVDESCKNAGGVDPSLCEGVDPSGYTQCQQQCNACMAAQEGTCPNACIQCANCLKQTGSCPCFMLRGCVGFCD